MKRNILVIDDDELVAKSISKLLAIEGYSAVMARSGKEALEKVKESEFDLVISDIRMPEMDGIETVKNIREYLTASNKKLIPEILITGYADNEKYEASLELKVSEYLYKPFDREHLLNAIKKTIG